MRTIRKVQEDITNVVAGGDYTLSVTKMIELHQFVGTHDVTGTLGITADAPVIESAEIRLFIPSTITVSGVGEILLFGVDISASLGSDLLYKALYVNTGWKLVQEVILPAT